jgi:hypothetical protein
MPDPTNYFRAHVLQTSTKRVPFLLAHFCQSKVCNPHMSFEIYHDIFWLKVPV